MAGKRSDAVQAARERLRRSLEGQLRIVQAVVRAEEDLVGAQERRKAVEAENEARISAVQAENQARVAEADEVIRARKAARAEALAGLAVVVNDDEETAALADVPVGDVRAARRAVPVGRAREVAATAGRPGAAAPASSNGARKPTPAAAAK